MPANDTGRGSLTLQRKPGESIYIGDDILVTVEHAPNGRIKVNVVAPLTLRIDRAEVRDSPDFKGGKAA